jgi:hypothetical protein
MILSLFNLFYRWEMLTTKLGTNPLFWGNGHVIDVDAFISMRYKAA